MSGIPGLQGIDHVALTVPDLDEATRFYCDVIGGTLLYELGPFDARQMPPSDDGLDWTEAHLDVADALLSFRVVQLGSVVLELFSYQRPAELSAAGLGDAAPGHGHIGFAVDDIAAATAYLLDQGVRVLSGPIDVPPEAPSGAMLNRYFADPWGNQLELTQRPGHAH
ncbi:MAG: VOC family protein [Ornithinimicrobium sp.]|uniref:VOC family protein n=1 Tax=Ornithinimicrobium sp. TaxID=1977084 RepID=UPI0026E0ECCE|nr:VOC family protein [Ornithinimicrobium sp.]MDO5739770.1 VOC family protein [Ornithinimicrobium sp.]